MKRQKPIPCPFCGKKPSGKKFCSTDRGPVLICDHCLAEGPPLLGEDEFVGGIAAERKLYPTAIAAWNSRKESASR